MAAVGAATAAAAALAAIWFGPDPAPVLASAAVALAVAATWAAIGAVANRRDSDVAALKAENAELARGLEEAADKAWELRDSEERYRSLNHARERAEAASLAKSRFLATVSHEFRTPLNGILGLNSLLLETSLTPAQETYARGVQSSGTALLTLIEDMLDFSKIEAGRLDIRPEPADLEMLVAEVAELLAGRAHQKRIDIAVSVDPGLPALVEVDPERLRQVLVNLAGNGVKFTDTGGVTIAVKVESYGSDQVRIGFSVADTGPGIAPEEADRLFGEFEQADVGAHPPSRRCGARPRHQPQDRRRHGRRPDGEPAFRWRLGVPLCTGPEDGRHRSALAAVAHRAQDPGHHA